MVTCCPVLVSSDSNFPWHRRRWLMIKIGKIVSPLATEAFSTVQKLNRVCPIMGLLKISKSHSGNKDKLKSEETKTAENEAKKDFRELSWGTEKQEVCATLTLLKKIGKDTPVLYWDTFHIPIVHDSKLVTSAQHLKSLEFSQSCLSKYNGQLLKLQRPRSIQTVIGLGTIVASFLLDCK